MLEALEKHVTLNSNHLRTYCDARLRIVTQAEAKFGLIIRFSKLSESGARGQSYSMNVDAINFRASGTGNGKGSSSPRDGCFKCGGNYFQRDCLNRATPSKGKGKKGKQSKSRPKSAGKEKR